MSRHTKAGDIDYLPIENIDTNRGKRSQMGGFFEDFMTEEQQNKMCSVLAKLMMDNKDTILPILDKMIEEIDHKNERVCKIGSKYSYKDKWDTNPYE